MHRPDPDREGRSTLSRLDKGQLRHTLLPIPVFSSFFLLDRESVWHLKNCFIFPQPLLHPCVSSAPQFHILLGQSLGGESRNLLGVRRREILRGRPSAGQVSPRGFCIHALPTPPSHLPRLG